MADPKPVKPGEKEEQKEQAGPSTQEYALFARFIAENAKKKAEENPSSRSNKKESDAKSTIVSALADFKLSYGNRSAEDAIELLRSQADGFYEAAKTGSDRSKDILNQKADAYVQAANFLMQQAESGGSGMLGNKSFEAWKQQRAEAAVKKVNASHEARATEARKEDQKVADAYREKISGEGAIEKERERFIEMVLKDGAVNMHTAVEGALSQRGNSGGFQSLYDARMQQKDGRVAQMNQLLENLVRGQDPRGARLRPNDLLLQHRQSEVVGFIREPDRQEMIEVEVPAEKGIFGNIKKPATRKMEPTGKKIPITHAEAVQGGKASEPLVWMSYYAKDASETASGDTAYRCYDGRYGNMLGMEIALPESTAKVIQDAIAKDPALIRKIVARLAKEKVLGKHADRWDHVTENGEKAGWDDRLSPPFERWDAAPSGGKIYVQPLDQLGWHEENLRPIGKK